MQWLEITGPPTFSSYNFAINKCRKKSFFSLFLDTFLGSKKDFNVTGFKTFNFEYTLKEVIYSLYSGSTIP